MKKRIMILGANDNGHFSTFDVAGAVRFTGRGEDLYGGAGRNSYL